MDEKSQCEFTRTAQSTIAGRRMRRGMSSSRPVRGEDERDTMMKEKRKISDDDIDPLEEQ
jgi:hypothetical protein